MPSDTLKKKPLVIQEMETFIGSSIRAVTRGRAAKVSFGDAGTGGDVDDIAYSPVSRKVYLEFTGDGATEAGRVIAYGRTGHELALEAVRHFTENYGTPATFQVVLSDQPQPGIYTKDGVATLLR